MCVRNMFMLGVPMTSELFVSNLFYRYFCTDHWSAKTYSSTAFGQAVCVQNIFFYNAVIIWRRTYVVDIMRLIVYFFIFTLPIKIKKIYDAYGDVMNVNKCQRCFRSFALEITSALIFLEEDGSRSKRRYTKIIEKQCKLCRLPPTRNGGGI